MSTDVCFEFPPYFIKYTDGRVERLNGTDVVPPSFDPNTFVESKDIVIPVTPIIPARLHKPKITIATSSSASCRKLPLVIYFHGGGFFINTPFNSMYHNFINVFAAQTNTIVISVHYGRPPEEPLPMAYDQCWRVVQWVTTHLCVDCDEWLREYADPKRVFFAGESAGANIAHNMAIRLGEDKTKSLKLGGMVLLCPYFWGKDPIPGETTDPDRRNFIDESWRIACPSTVDSDDPFFNPVKDPTLSNLGCRKVLVCVAGEDTYKYRGWYYYETLRNNGWGGTVEIMETAGEDHAFFMFNPDSPNAKALLKRVACFIT